MSKLLNPNTVNYLINFHIKNVCLIRQPPCFFKIPARRCLHLDRRPTQLLPLRRAAVTRRHLSLTPAALSATPDLTEALTDTKVVDGLSTIVADPSVTDVGLSFLPRLVEHLLTNVHLGLDLPWCGAIAVCTLIFRLMLFPMVVKSQKNAIHMSKHMPEVQKRQMAMLLARQTGDKDRVAACAGELAEYIKKNDVNPFKTLLPAFAQAPVFISMFWCLRGMANYPVESFKTGGLLWFHDLTIPDPYFVLPLMTCTTLLVCLEMGADGMQTSQFPQLKNVIRALPVIMFPFIMNFPAAILCYWGANNVITLGQVLLLKHEPIRQWLNMPKFEPPPVSEAYANKGFFEGFKESVNNMKMAVQLEERKRIEELARKKNNTSD